MSFIKRLSTTVVTRLDRVVDQLENHDAVVQAALTDLQRKVAEAKVRCNRVMREREQVSEQAATRRREAAQWRQRAQQCGHRDEAQALECLARARRAGEESDQLEARSRGYAEAAAKLEAAVATLEDRLVELRQKQVLMRAREATGGALSATTLAEQWGTGTLDEVMERWEIKVLATELDGECSVAPDPLERSFNEREREAALRAELKTLLAEHPREDDHEQ